MNLLWQYNHAVDPGYSDELCHYGVKGMKWGVRRAKRIRAEKAGKRASLRKMSDKERNRYAKGRVEIMKSKRGAILSETGNLLGKELKTLLAGAGAGVGAGAGGFASVAAVSSALGWGVATSAAVTSAVSGAALAIPVGIAVGKFAVNGARYVKNLAAINRSDK